MRYTYFASTAKKEGYEQIAAIFTETADQEKEDVYKRQKQELSTRVDIPFYTKAGYQQYSAETLKKNPNKQYLGLSLIHI